MKAVLRRSNLRQAAHHEMHRKTSLVVLCEPSVFLSDRVIGCVGRSENRHWGFKIKVADLMEFTSQEPWGSHCSAGCVFSIMSCNYSFKWSDLLMSLRHAVGAMKRRDVRGFCFLPTSAAQGSSSNATFMSQETGIPRCAPSTSSYIKLGCSLVILLAHFDFPLFVFSLCSFTSFFGSLCLLPI